MLNIVIPTYPPHIKYNNRLLESIQKFSDNREVQINFIISKYDIPTYQKELRIIPNVNLITLSDILRVVENKDLDENNLLYKLKKFNYQSIKKLYGAFFVAQEFGAENVLVLDSENILVRPCNLRNLIDGWLRKKTVLVDRVPGYGIQLAINKRVGEILKKPVNFWGAVQSHWVYNKALMEQMFNEIPVFQSFLGPSIFESILYNAYIYQNSDIQFVDQRSVLEAHMPTVLFHHLKNLQTTVEYAIWGIQHNDDLLDQYIAYLKDSRARLTNVANVDYYTVNRIVNETDVEMLTYMGNP